MIRDRRFLRYYEQELRFLRDVAGEFASEHARIANRFGLDADACADPHVEWLLDGAAFLAARVQHRLDGDYTALTHHLLEMIYPDYLAPTPAAAIVELQTAPDAPALEGGFRVPRGTRLLSRIVPGESTRCIFTTAHEVTIWPVEITDARYLALNTLAAQNVPRPAGVRSAIAITLRTRNGLPFSSLSLDSLPLHLASHDRIAHTLYEAMLAHGVALVGRAKGDLATTQRLGGREAIGPCGFGDDQALLPPNPRGFSGYRLLREYFMLPERFLFVELRRLQRFAAATGSDEIELLVLLDTADPVLDSAVTEQQFALFATPAINLFPRRAKPILVEPFDREHHVVGDRLRPLDYEVFSVTGVTGYGEDERELLRFAPFYTVEPDDPTRVDAFYSVERRPRLLSEREERSRAPRSVYLGSELWLQLCSSDGSLFRGDVRRLDVETVCTNRDLPLRLPLPREESHFTPEAAGPVSGARVIGGLTAPRSSLATLEPQDGGPWGDVAWRLIGHLALNYHSLVDGPDDRSADALRSLLELYAGTAEPQIARHVEAVRSISTRKVTRRLPGGGPIAFGRGLEIHLELVEGVFQEGSPFLLGSVLETFFRRYVTINSFTETVLGTPERGQIMRWPSAIGTRSLA
jgi:type VI secretion system protein ImpG